MAQVVGAIQHLLLCVFAPALGITLEAWLVMLFVQLFSGKRYPFRAAAYWRGHERAVASSRCL